jgi:uncharacterized protein (TIGR02594 family)
MTDTVPPWLATMRQITGTSAATDNAVIVGWAKKIGDIFPDTAPYCAQYTQDTIAWCGLTVGYCMAINGIKPVFGATATDRFFWALAWRQFGTPAASPQPGDVLVFDFGDGDHHVTLYEQSQESSYICLGGNQSHQVKLSTYPKSQCIDMRRPPAADAAIQVVAPDVPVHHFTGITATVFGGAADPNTSAYDGHLIDDTELGVALPFHFQGAPPPVRLWNDGKSVVCKIVDVGPWNTNDPYWQTGARPQAESGVDSSGRPTNRAGIDLTPAAARAIAISGKGLVDWEFADLSQIQPSPPSPPQAQPQPQPPPPVSDPVLAQLKQLIGRLETIMPAPPTTPAQPTITTPATQPLLDFAALIPQVIALIQAINPPASPTASGLQTQGQINQLIDLINALTGKQAPVLLPPNTLGPVNGALGQTIGNLLNGSKSAIGILGALASQLVQAPGLAGLAPILGTTVAPYATPIFLAIAAWGVLGKMEKWAQAVAPATASQPATPN